MKTIRVDILSMILGFLLIFSGKSSAAINDLNLKLPFIKGEKFVVTCTYQDTRSACITHAVLKANGTKNKDEWAIDFSIVANKSIIAVSSGIAHIYPNSTGGYGNYVVLDHGSGYTTQYSHLNSISIKEGEKIFQGQEIGKSGSTGLSTAAHLHFALYYNDGTKNWSIKPTPMSGFTEFVSGVSYRSDNYIYPVGRITDNILNPVIYDAYVNNGGYAKLGLPFDDSGGTKYVHLWSDIVYTQNYRHINCQNSICTTPSSTGKSPYGIDGQTAIMYNEKTNQAFLVKESFWGKYKENNGPEILGPPTSDEYSFNDIHESIVLYGYNSTRQDFASGYLIYGWTTGDLRMYTKSGVSLQVWKGNICQTIALADTYLDGGNLTLASLSPDFANDLTASATKVIISGSDTVSENTTNNQFFARVDYVDGSSVVASKKVGWEFDCSVGSISKDGLLSTTSVNSDTVCQVKAIYGNLSASLAITVKNVIPAKITFTDLIITGPEEVDEKSTSQYQAVVYYSDGSQIDITNSPNAGWQNTCLFGRIPKGTFTIAEVDYDQLCDIEVYYQYKTYQLSGGVKIKNIITSESLVEVKISGPLVVNENSGAQYFATAIYDDGTEIDITNSVYLWFHVCNNVRLSTAGYLTTLSSQTETDQKCDIRINHIGKQYLYPMVIKNVVAGVADKIAPSAPVLSIL